MRSIPAPEIAMTAPLPNSAPKPTATPTGLLHDILEPGNLFAAWEKVRANAGMAGVDGQRIEHYEHNVFGRLLTLKHQVERNEYQPLPLLKMEIAKPAGGMRSLAVPTVRDRILQTAATRILAPILDRHLEEASYAYRAGRSVPMAVARVAHYRDQGYQWVVDADIHTFFDQIDHALLLAKLRRTLDDHSPIALIELWLAAIVQPGNGAPSYLLTQGVPQGSPISPLLSNLYLDDFDEALLEENLRLVRFADDFLILCQDRQAAEQAMELTEDVVETLRLKLKPEKTRITHFDQGFSFLGVDFIRNLMQASEPDAARWVMPKPRHFQELSASNPSEIPAAAPSIPPDEAEPEPQPAQEAETYLSPRETLAELPGHPTPTEPLDLEYDYVSLEENPALEPVLRSLIVLEPGLTLLKEGERLLVTKARQPVASIPLAKLDQVIVHGNQLISTALFRHAHQSGLVFAFEESHGRPLGRFDNRRNGNLELHRKQFGREKEADFALMLARAFVTGKLHNRRLVLRRHNRRRQLTEIDAAETAMADLEYRLARAPTLDVVRGLEGAAAREYFQALKILIPEHWGFPGRRRSPPGDPFNVLLSYGYGVLFNNVHTLIERRNLNPWLGFLHTANGRHPALVSDLMEEFRAPIVDAVAINALINVLKPEDFIFDGDHELPCRLTDSARKKYIAWLQNKFRAGILHPRTGQKLDHHRLVQYQVWHYARVILGEEPVYQPCRLK
jgi:CRISPR-associated protein Cas1